VSERPTVLHVITRLELGGAQRNTLYTVGHLDPSRFRAALAWGPGDRLDREAEMLDDVVLRPVPALVRPIRPLADAAAVRHLREVIRELRPAIVHTHSSKAGILGRLAAHRERVPVVIHSVHGFGFTPLQPAAMRAVLVALERRAARWTDHFIAVSRANLDLGARLRVLDPARTSVIRSGIHIDRFRDPTGGRQLRDHLGVPEGGALVTQVGNFKPQKAPLDFIRMAALVAEEAPETRFLMVGDGPLRRRSEDLARRLGIAGVVHLSGWLDDVPAVWAATDVAVLTSHHEGLPRVVVEALAAGVPVVAAAVDGIVEVVRDHENGYLVPRGDVAAMSRRVLELVRDPVLRRRLAGAPRQLEDFDIDAMVRRQEELYQWLLGRARC
jgi:glycosyltransferase involved in cell wall biosynthesis